MFLTVYSAIHTLKRALNLLVHAAKPTAADYARIDAKNMSENPKLDFRMNRKPVSIVSIPEEHLVGNLHELCGVLKPVAAVYIFEIGRAHV